jgi:hypothetical protein
MDLVKDVVPIVGVVVARRPVKRVKVETEHPNLISNTALTPFSPDHRDGFELS